MWEPSVAFSGMHGGCQWGHQLPCGGPDHSMRRDQALSSDAPSGHHPDVHLLPGAPGFQVGSSSTVLDLSQAFASHMCAAAMSCGDLEPKHRWPPCVGPLAWGVALRISLEQASGSETGLALCSWLTGPARGFWPSQAMPGPHRLQTAQLGTQVHGVGHSLSQLLAGDTQPWPCGPVPHSCWLHQSMMVSTGDVETWECHCTVQGRGHPATFPGPPGRHAGARCPPVHKLPPSPPMCCVRTGASGGDGVG